MKRGIVEACTGVIRLKPMLSTASMIHSASEGVKASQARDDEEDMWKEGLCATTRTKHLRYKSFLVSGKDSNS